MAHLCKKKKREKGGRRGASFGVQLPRDGMKILHWSSNPKLPSKNIPLPPRRDPDLFACRAEAGRGWAAQTRGQTGDKQGQADGRGAQVQLTGLGRLDADMRCCTVPTRTGRNMDRVLLLLSDKEYFHIGQYGRQDLIVP